MSTVMLIRAAEPGDLAEVRAMLSEYQQWLGVDLSYQDFAREVADLPGEYHPPGGALLIAQFRADTVGMVALRRRDDGTAEMKRLFVRPAARGTGVGRTLVEHVIAIAREMGYRSMVLDTLPVMESAQRLYEALGFRDVPAYYSSPVPGTRYMALTLAPEDVRSRGL